MNIFVLDLDTKKCAEYHNDKHCVKMILEYSQILCGVHHMSNPTSTPTSTLQVPYKLSHKNHPCSIWARECIENYIWLCDLALDLCDEYRYRYGRRHKSQDVIEWCLVHKPNIPLLGRMTSQALAMPNECKIRSNNSTIDSYRNYYMTDKRHIANWKNREVPYWYK